MVAKEIAKESLQVTYSAAQYDLENLERTTMALWQEFEGENV